MFSLGENILSCYSHYLIKMFMECLPLLTASRTPAALLSGTASKPRKMFLALPSGPTTRTYTSSFSMVPLSDDPSMRMERKLAADISSRSFANTDEYTAGRNLTKKKPHKFSENVKLDQFLKISYKEQKRHFEVMILVTYYQDGIDLFSK